MPILQQIGPQPETITGFETAAEAKYEDGFSLMTYASPGNGIYLMGYAAEMLLKSAYFRVAGLGLTVPITRSHLRQARADAVSLAVAAGDEQFHNLAFWSELLIKKRVQQSRAMTAALAAELDRRAKRLAQNWFVEMRYQRLQGVTVQDVDDVLDDVVWVKSNYQALWR